MSSTDRSARSLPPVVRHLGIVSFFNDLASEMVYPLLPALVTARLGGTAVALGALDGIAEAASAAAKLFSGRLADHPGRRRGLVVIGYGVAGIARPVMGLAGAAWHVVGLRGADRLGKGLRNPPRDTVIADATVVAQRGRAFGFHRAMDHAGAVAGPLVAWALIAGASMEPADVIVWSVIPGIVAVGVVTWALTHLRPAGESTVDQTDEVVPPSGGGRLVFGLILAFAFARMPETLLLLRLQDLGVSVALVPVLWSLLHVVRSSASYPGGWLSDRIGPRSTMALGWLLYALVSAGLAWSSTALTAAAWFMVFGLVAGATEGPERSFVSAAGARSRRGSRFGLYHAGVGLAALPGSLALGVVYEMAEASVALVASGALALVLALTAWGAPPSLGRRYRT
jgi:MFS family permease